MKVIFGASGCAKDTYLILRRLNQEQYSNTPKVDFFVSNEDDPLAGSFLNGIPVMRESEFFNQFSEIPIEAYIAVGAPMIRRKIAQKIKNWNFLVSFPKLIDPSVVMDQQPGAIYIGEGAIIYPGSIMTTDVKIGAFCQINLNCTISHDVSIGEFTTLSPGSHISGNVDIGNDVFCGAGSVILEGLRVVASTIIGAGAVVVNHINSPGVYVGIPAKAKTS